VVGFSWKYNTRHLPWFKTGRHPTRFLSFCDICLNFLLPLFVFPNQQISMGRLKIHPAACMKIYSFAAQFFV